MTADRIAPCIFSTPSGIESNEVIVIGADGARYKATRRPLASDAAQGVSCSAREGTSPKGVRYCVGCHCMVSFEPLTDELPTTS